MTIEIKFPLFKQIVQSQFHYEFFPKLYKKHRFWKKLKEIPSRPPAAGPARTETLFPTSFGDSAALPLVACGMAGRTWWKKKMGGGTTHRLYPTTFRRRIIA